MWEDPDVELLNTRETFKTDIYEYQRASKDRIKHVMVIAMKNT